MLLAVLAGVALACWTAQGARLAALSWPGRTLRLPVAAGIVAGAVVFAVWLSWWMSYGSNYANGYWYDAQGERQVVQGWIAGSGPVHPAMTTLFAWTIPEIWYAAFEPLVPAAAVLVWLVPLGFWSIGALGHGAEQRPVPPLRQVVRPGLLGGSVAAVAVVGIQAWLHTMQRGPSQRGGLYAFSYAAWSAGAVVLAAVVAAVLGLRVARFRTLAALIAAGLAMLVGLAAATVLMSVDGCVRPLSVLNSGCAWHPAWQKWTVNGGFSLLIHTTLLLGPVAAALVALAFGLGRWAVRVGRRAEGPVAFVRQRNRPAGSAERRPIAPRPIGPGPRGLAAVSLAASGALVIAVALTIADAPTESARVGLATLDSTRFRLESVVATLPVSASVHRRQVHAWFRLGGRYLLDHEAGDMHDLAVVLKPGISGSQLTVNPTMMAKAEPICEDMFRVAGWEHNGAYFDIPDQAAETSWNRFGDDAWDGSVACAGAVRAKDEGAFLKAVITLVKASGDADSVRQRVTAVIDDPQDSVFQGKPIVPAHL
jgi:hypothetical protein